MHYLAFNLDRKLFTIASEVTIKKTSNDLANHNGIIIPLKELPRYVLKAEQIGGCKFMWESTFRLYLRW